MPITSAAEIRDLITKLRSYFGDEVLEEAFKTMDVFETKFFLTPEQQSKTPVRIIVGKQGQLGIQELLEDGSKRTIFMNKYEVEVLKKVLLYRF